MADWAILGEQVAAVIARKEGKEYELGTFLKAFDKNLDILNTKALKSSLVAEALIAFMTHREILEQKTTWEGSPTMLLAELNTFIAQNSDSVKINTRSKAWPQDPSTLGKELARIKPNLTPLGIIIDSTRTNKNILYKITKMPTQNGQNWSTIGESNHKNVEDVDNVVKTPNSGVNSDYDSLLLMQILEKVMKDEQGSNKGYFTKDDWVFACQIWPNLHWTIEESEQTLYALMEEGKIREISGKPGTYERTSSSWINSDET